MLSPNNIQEKTDQILLLLPKSSINRDSFEKWQKVGINTCGHKYVKIDRNINTVAIIINSIRLKHPKMYLSRKIFQINCRKSSGAFPYIGIEPQTNFCYKTMLGYVK